MKTYVTQLLGAIIYEVEVMSMFFNILIKWFIVSTAGPAPVHQDLGFWTLFSKCIRDWREPVKVNPAIKATNGRIMEGGFESSNNKFLSIYELNRNKFGKNGF